MTPADLISEIKTLSPGIFKGDEWKCPVLVRISCILPKKDIPNVLKKVTAIALLNYKLAWHKLYCPICHGTGVSVTLGEVLKIIKIILNNNSIYPTLGPLITKKEWVCRWSHEINDFASAKEPEIAALRVMKAVLEARK